MFIISYVRRKTMYTLCLPNYINIEHDLKDKITKYWLKKKLCLLINYYEFVVFLSISTW